MARDDTIALYHIDEVRQCSRVYVMTWDKQPRYSSMRSSRYAKRVTRVRASEAYTVSHLFVIYCTSDKRQNKNLP